jgi:hypothetical protein
VNSDVLVNYRHDDAVATSARVFIVIVVFSTFAICQFVGRYVNGTYRIWKGYFSWATC